MSWTTLLFACVLFAVCAASPTRRQFAPPETTSTGPLVTSDGEAWDDSEDFDLDGDEDWLGESAASPSSIPLRAEYEDYDDDDDDDDFAAKRGAGDSVVATSDDDDDVEHQDAEEDEDQSPPLRVRNDAEFLFLPSSSSDTRLMLQDDDGDQSGLIKVRHTGKNSYPEVASNSLEEDSKDEDDGQFEFTLGDDDDEDKENELEKDDFVLEDDTQAKDGGSSIEELPRRGTRDDEDDNDDDDVDDDPAFESPEEDSQVIYGDHVFLY